MQHNFLNPSDCLWSLLLTRSVSMTVGYFSNRVSSSMISASGFCSCISSQLSLFSLLSCCPACAQGWNTTTFLSFKILIAHTNFNLWKFKVELISEMNTNVFNQISTIIYQLIHVNLQQRLNNCPLTIVSSASVSCACFVNQSSKTRGPHFSASSL